MNSLKLNDFKETEIKFICFQIVIFSENFATELLPYHYLRGLKFQKANMTGLLITFPAFIYKTITDLNFVACFKFNNLKLTEFGYNVCSLKPLDKK